MIQIYRNFFFIKKIKQKKIAVAMSGGIDSSASALYLKNIGHLIVGVSLIFTFNRDKKNIKKCCGTDDLNDARIICSFIKMPFYLINFQRLFNRKVIHNFVIQYKKGLTPIPCLDCNDIKFGNLYEIIKLMKLKLATGHYARIIKYKGFKAIGKSFDLKKNQTYYLYNISIEIINNVYFPVGNFNKKIIKFYIKKAKMIFFKKKESQDICFISKKEHYSFFLKKKMKNIFYGNFLNIYGKRIGNHRGIYKYTIGQRRKLNSYFNGKMYVVNINSINNKITLGEKGYLLCSKIMVKNINFCISSELWPNIVKVQIRSNGKLFFVNYLFKIKNIFLFFHEKILFTSLGQSAVFYDNNALLGGGVISFKLNGFRLNFF